MTEMPYLFRQAGCEVHVLSPATNQIRQCGFIDHWMDAGQSMRELLVALRQHALSGMYQRIVVGDDPLLWLIAHDSDPVLRSLLSFSHPDPFHFLSKTGFAQHCQRYGIPTPSFVEVKDAAAADQAVQQLGFPLVFKTNYSNGGNGVTVVRDAQAYAAWKGAHDWRMAVLAQAMIDGTQWGVEALFKNGRLVQYVCSQDIDPGLGPSTQRCYCPNEPRVGGIVRRLGESAGLHGFANISLMHGKRDDAFYLFEADPRPNKWVPYGHWFGCDFVRGIREWLVDGDVDDSWWGGPHPGEQSTITQWEIEHFSTHFGKLWNQGRQVHATMHMLDFDRNIRYTLYDPVLLKHKMDDMRRQFADFLTQRGG